MTAVIMIKYSDCIQIVTDAAAYSKDNKLF